MRMYIHIITRDCNQVRYGRAKKKVQRRTLTVSNRQINLM